MKRTENEQFLDYCQRITKAAQNREITYEEWAEAILGDCFYGDETMRRANKIFAKFFDKLEEENIENIDDKDLIAKIRREKEELLKERKKLQTANIEYHANLRNDARGEMFNDRILEAIENLPDLDLSPFRSDGTWTGSTGLLCIGDAHYGVQIELKSLFGEVVNSYSPEICQARLRNLAKMVVDDYDKFAYDKLIVVDVGDAIQGILRQTDLAKLRVGVLDSALEYAEVIARWLVALRDELHIPIEYKGCGGNHDILRLLDTKKQFEEENIMKVIVAFVKLRLKDVDGIIVDDFAETQFMSLYGRNILAYHGDDAKDAVTEINFWENYNNISIDDLILGHLHHKTEQSAGYGELGDRDVVHIPGLVGADTYGKKCRKISHAGAKFILYEENCGKSWEKVYWLN